MCQRNPQTHQTNPRYPSFTQAIYTAGDVYQFDDARTKTSLIKRDIDESMNMYPSYEYVRIWDQLYVDLYFRLDSRSVNNTFEYLFYKFKKGLFVKLSDNLLTNFIPFSNANYRNEFADMIKVDPARWPSVQAFLDYANSLSGFKPSRALPLDKWIANNGMFRYEYQQNEGDNNVVILQDMFKTLCAERQVPDTEFFVNRRDYPLLTINGTEPYNNLYGTRYQTLVSHAYEKYAPILSGSTTFGYADLAMPTYEDWARAKYQADGTVFPNACKKYPKIESPEWDKKKPIAVFRGASTGSGTTIDTNQRLKALAIADSLENDGRLDVGITSWNTRPRKYETDVYLSTIERASYIETSKLSLQQQSKYKYILTLEGHVAAYRLSYELSSGSVVLLAKSRWQMWYYRFLKPYIHYVPVENDLSDLLERVDWCRGHDDECRKIAENARQFYDKYLGVNGILDFLQRLLMGLVLETGLYDYLPNLTIASLNSEQSYLDRVQFSDTLYSYPISDGPRRISRLDSTLSVFRSKRESDLPIVKSLFKNKNGTVDVCKTNNFYMVKKTALNRVKQREHTHEAFLGLTAINGLCAKCPNFAYVYGKTRDADSVYVEYINGITLEDWLKSPQYNFKDYVKILIQLCLALQVAQSYCGFVHYDLYPWNVIVQTLKRETTFDYNIGYGVPIRCATSIIPTMIDFGKSRAIVYEKEYGLIDHGLINLYRSNPAIDTLTILYSTIKVLDRRLLPIERNVLMQFIAGLALPMDVDETSKYGALIDILNDRVADFIFFSPMMLIDHLSKTRGDSLTLATTDGTINFKLIMEHGLPLIDAAIMRTGNERTALLEYIVRINRQTRPAFTNAVMRNISDSMLARRLVILDEKVAASTDALTKKKYAIVRKLVDSTSYPQPKLTSADILLDLPDPVYVPIDTEITPQYLRDIAAAVNASKEDWLTIWMISVEHALFNGFLLDSDYNAFNDSFIWLSAIANNCTILKLRSTLLED
jgi:hypothetical protein